MNERRNDLEIMIEHPRIASQIPNSDRSPLYDVRKHARASRKGGNMRSNVSRTIWLAAIRTSRSTFRLRHAPPKAKRGGARRDRTDDLMLAKHALSQLSYGPVPEDECLH